MSKKTSNTKNVIKNANMIVRQAKVVSKAKKSASKKSVTLITDKLKSKRSYKFRDIPIPPKSNILDYALELEQHPELDALREPGELWAFTLNGGKSTSIYETLDLAAGALSRYHLRQDLNEDVEQVRFVKFSGSNPSPNNQMDEDLEDKVIFEYQSKRKKIKAKKRMQNEKIFESARNQVATITGSKPRGAMDIIKGLGAINKSLVAQMDAMNKRLVELEKQMKPKSKKKVGKKQASKKVVLKKAATKKQTPVFSTRKSSVKKNTGKVKHVVKPVAQKKKASKKIENNNRKTASSQKKKVTGKKVAQKKASKLTKHKKG